MGIEAAISALAERVAGAPHTWRLVPRLVSFCLAALLSFACAWVFGDSREQLQQVKQQVERLRALNAEADVAAGQLIELQARLRTVRERIEQGSQGFLLADELPDLLDLIAGLSAGHGVALDSLVVEDVLRRPRIDLQPLSLALRGAYRDIGFLHAEFGNLPWPMVVAALQASAEQSDGRVLDVQVQLLVPVVSL